MGGVPGGAVERVGRRGPRPGLPANNIITPRRPYFKVPVPTTTCHASRAASTPPPAIGSGRCGDSLSRSIARVTCRGSVVSLSNAVSTSAAGVATTGNPAAAASRAGHGSHGPVGVSNAASARAAACPTVSPCVERAHLRVVAVHDELGRGLLVGLGRPGRPVRTGGEKGVTGQGGEMVLSVNEVDPIRAGVPRGGRDGPKRRSPGRPRSSAGQTRRLIGHRAFRTSAVVTSATFGYARWTERSCVREHPSIWARRVGAASSAWRNTSVAAARSTAALRPPRQREIVHVAPGRFAEPRRNVLDRARPPMSGSSAGGQLNAASGCAARGSEAAAPKSRDGAEDISTRDSWQREAIRGIRSRSAHAARDAVILPAGPSSGPGSQRSRPSWTSARQRPDSACHGRSGPGRHRRGGDPLPTLADPQRGDEGVARRGVRPPAAIPPWRASHGAPPAPDPSAVDRARLTLVERVHQLERPFFEGQTARDAAGRPVRVGRRPRTGIGRYGGA